MLRSKFVNFRLMFLSFAKSGMIKLKRISLLNINHSDQMAMTIMNKKIMSIDETNNRSPSNTLKRAALDGRNVSIKTKPTPRAP